MGKIVNRMSKFMIMRSHLVFVVIAAVMAAPPVFGQEWAGTVKAVAGTVAAEREGKAVPLRLGDKVFPGDKLVSGQDSRIAVTLRDDTLVSMDANTQLVINEFAFSDSTHEGNLLVSISRGVVAMVSGLVAKANPSAMRVTTPGATLGIRGTEFIVEVGSE